MSLSRFIKRNPLEAGGIAIAVVSVGFSIPGMFQNAQMMGEVSRQIQIDGAQQQRLIAQQESLKAKEEIARNRFKSCLFIRSPGKQTLIAVAPGIQVVDTETRVPLAPNTIVCSIDGNTGVIGQNGMVMDVAFTGDRAAIQEAIQRSGIELAAGDRQFGSSNRTFQK
jgi:hypothetical protein